MNSPELKLQHECVMTLRRHGIFCHSVPNEAGGRSKILQMQLMAAGLTPGVSDLVVWWPEDEWFHGNPRLPLPKGYPVSIGYVEFKTPTGRQSEHQKTFQKLCIECGVEYALIRTREDMERLIEGHLFSLA